MRIPVKGVGDIGLVPDLPSEELPLGAWTSGRNIRFRDHAVEKFAGHSEIYPTPLWPPYWLLNVNRAGSNYWLYASTAKVGATDEASHADITRAVGGDYATDLEVGWTGTTFEGIPVINNSVDPPQVWNAPSLVQKLTALPNWPAATTAGALRAFKRYLVALNVTKGATNYPNMVKWSHRAAANALPDSWDETDETRDAGEFTIPAEGGAVIDAFMLRDLMIVYKEYQTWLMQFIGGNDIFAFRRAFGTFGMLTRRCAVEFFLGKHLVFTGDDLVVHDSQNVQSVLDGRAKKLLQGQINPDFYRRCFVADNLPASEVWVGYPEAGHTLPNKALVWGWKDNSLKVRDLPNAAFIASGIIDPIAATELWSGAVGDWGSDSASWGDKTFDPSQRKMLMAVPGELKLHLIDTTRQFNGANVLSFVERRGLGFPLEQGAPPDYANEKQLNGIWPRITGTPGGVVNVYVGRQQTVDGEVAWEAPLPFIIGTTNFIDFVVTARLHALRFESDSNIEWKLTGYDVDIVPAGSGT